MPSVSVPEARADIELARAAERTERSAWASVYRRAASELVRDGDLRLVEDDVAAALMNHVLPDWSLNRVCGLFGGAAPDERWLAHHLGLFAAQRLPCTVACHPVLDADGLLERAMRARGARAARTWFKMVRDASPPTPSSTSLRVEQVGADARPLVAEIIARGFGLPLGMAAVFAHVLGSDDWRGYIAYDADTAVATGLLHLDGHGGGWLGAAATVPEHRNRGGQSAIMAARIAEASRMGCAWVTTETGVPQGEGGNPSLNNMVRHGFAAICQRPNLVIDPV